MTISKQKLLHDITVIANNSDKNEKLAWMRKAKKMKELISKLEPFEAEMLELLQRKQPLLDEIEDLRKVMAKECIHPEDYLIHHGKHVSCKFCNAKIMINSSLVDE